jgi:DNA-binding CsgD family transcriptional regulator/PAS domain-containing protein
MQDDILSNADFSGVVGTIYDCALDPTLWPDAICELCRLTNCAAGTIHVSGLDSGMVYLHQVWNHDLNFLTEMQSVCGEEVTELWTRVPNLMTRPLDDPLTAKRDIAPALLANSRFLKEWAVPLGYSDTIQLIVLRRPERIGALGLFRHISAGDVTDRELNVLRLLAPHIRRAVKIGVISNMQAMNISTIESALDLLQAGVLLVDCECRIIHANQAARSMLQEGTPIQTALGELRTHLPQATAALKKAVTDVETTIGHDGISLALPISDGEAAHAHVLPLWIGRARSRLARGASAALFITTKGDGEALPAGAITALFNLSPAEVRVLERLIAGRTPAEIADDLGSALATVRTHLSNIFTKTGTTRQVDLICLSAALAGPTRRK